MVYIYGIIQESTNQLLYVGQTVDPYARFIRHKSSTVKDIRDDCRMEIIEEGADKGSHDEFFWISYFRSLGCNLLNRDVSAPSGRAAGRNGFPVPMLVHYMKQRGVRGEDVASSTGLSMETVRNAQRGKPMAFSTIKALARYLKIDTNKLLQQKESTT